jgi:hypothetical protein
MKRTIFIICFIAAPMLNAFAQNYIGFGAGMENFNGLLGVGAELGLSDQVALRAGVGIGSWGSKIGGGFLVRRTSESRWRFHAGFSSCSGLRDAKLDLPVASGATAEVIMDLKRQGVLIVSALRTWESRGGNLFNLEFGYSIPAGGVNFYTIKNGVVLSDQGRLVMNIVRPGGLTLAISYLFRLKKR